MGAWEPSPVERMHFCRKTAEASLVLGGEARVVHIHLVVENTWPSWLKSFAKLLYVCSLPFQICGFFLFLVLHVLKSFHFFADKV